MVMALLTTTNVRQRNNDRRDFSQTKISWREKRIERVGISAIARPAFCTSAIGVVQV
jgi:hypothetical protein